MSNKYKHHNIIVAWLEGKDIQFCVEAGAKWLPVPSSSTASMVPRFSVKNIYRIKSEPIVIVYRRFVCKIGNTTFDVSALHKGLPWRTPAIREKDSDFIRWIDYDWQYEEV